MFYNLGTLWIVQLCFPASHSHLMPLQVANTIQVTVSQKLIYSQCCSIKIALGGYFFKLINYVIYFWLCWNFLPAWTCPYSRRAGLLSRCGSSLLIALASLVEEHRL